MKNLQEVYKVGQNIRYKYNGGFFKAQIVSVKESTIDINMSYRCGIWFLMNCTPNNIIL